MGLSPIIQHVMKNVTLCFLFLMLLAGMLQAQQFQNLLANPGAHTDMDGWTLGNIGGDGWQVIDGEGSEGTKCWTGSFEWSTKSQLIDLIQYGYDPVTLDAAPIVIFSEKYHGRGAGGTSADRYNLYIELRDANQNVISNFNSGEITTTDDWQTISGSFRKYGSGLRYIYYEHSSVDGDYWAGNYGAQIDASSISIQNNITYTGGQTFDFSGWEIDNNGGDGWRVDGYFTSSYGLCTKHQVIDLMALGYTAEEMDMEPRIDFGEFLIGHQPNFADVHTLKVELRDANQNPIAIFDKTTTATDGWQWVGNFFDGYGPGVRYIYFEHSGIDAEFWAGHYGTVIDYSYVGIEQVEVWATGISNTLEELSMQIKPNPVVDHCILEIRHANLTNASVQIINMNGQVVSDEFLGDLQDQTLIHPLVFPGLAKGVYQVHLKSDQGIKTTPLMVR